MKSLLAAAALIAAIAAAPALANDTMSQLGTGGLVFVTSDDVSMDTEDLSVSPAQVKVATGWWTWPRLKPPPLCCL